MTPHVTKAYRKVYHLKLSEDQIQAMANGLAGFFNLMSAARMQVSVQQTTLIHEALLHMREVMADTKPIIMLTENL